MPVKGRSPDRITNVDCGACPDQSLDQLLMAALGSQVQRRLTRRGFCIDLSSGAQKKSCHLNMPVASGHVQRGPAQFAILALATTAG